MDERECTIDNPRPCELAVAVGFARDICSQEGIECPSLESIFREGYESEQDVLDALLDFVQAVPESRRVEAMAVMCSAFPLQDGCKELFEEEG